MHLGSVDTVLLSPATDELTTLRPMNSGLANLMGSAFRSMLHPCMLLIEPIAVDPQARFSVPAGLVNLSENLCHSARVS